MPIRPIDFQNMIARINFMSKRVSNIITQKEGLEKIKDKQIKQKAIVRKKEIESIKKIIEQGNKIQKILGQTPYKKQEHQKKKNHYYKNLSEDEHHFEEKI